MGDNISVPRILSLIPARTGSKGVPNKNARELRGKPLIEYSVESWKQSNIGGRLVVSTDSVEIANIATNCGAEVPFMRPSFLAQDTTPMWQVVLHALESLGSVQFDCVVLLQPSAPFRLPTEIANAVDLFFAHNADTVVTVAAVPAHYNPYWVYFSEGDGRLIPCIQAARPYTRRQDLPPVFHRTGGVYVVRPSLVFNDHTLIGIKTFGLEVDISQQVNIDSICDWSRAERILDSNKSFLAGRNNETP